MDEDSLKAKKPEKLNLIEIVLLILILGTLVIALYDSIIRPGGIDFLSIIGSFLGGIPLLMCISKFREYRKGKEPKWLVEFASAGLFISFLGAVMLIFGFSLELLLGYRVMLPLEVAAFILYVSGCITFARYSIYILKTIKKDYTE